MRRQSRIAIGALGVLLVLLLAVAMNVERPRCAEGSVERLFTACRLDSGPMNRRQ